MGQQSPWIVQAQSHAPFALPDYLTRYTETNEYPEGLWFRLMCVAHEPEAKLMGVSLWLAYAHYESIWENDSTTGDEGWKIVRQCERDFFRDGRAILQHFGDKVPVNPEQYNRILDYIWEIGGDCDDALHFVETLDSEYIPYTR